MWTERWFEATTLGRDPIARLRRFVSRKTVPPEIVMKPKSLFHSPLPAPEPMA